MLLLWDGGGIGSIAVSEKVVFKVAVDKNWNSKDISFLRHDKNALAWEFFPRPRDDLGVQQNAIIKSLRCKIWASPYSWLECVFNHVL
jgi:hypothetical protein